MEEYRIKQIIEKILKGQLKKKVFLMIDGSDVYVKEVVKILNKYDRLQYNYIESESSKYFTELDKVRCMGDKLNSLEEIEDAIENADLILVPFLTRNTLAKISLGIADDILTNSIQLAIMMNKTIIALDSLCNPNSESNKIKKLNLNTAYNKILFNYKNTVEQFGVKLIPIYELHQDIERTLNSSDIQKIQNNNYNEESKDKAINVRTIKDEKISYITKKDIEGKESLHINKDIRLTHLAKEYILENSIKVIEEK